MNALGNKEIMARNIRYYMNILNVSRNDMCDALGVKYTTLTDWIKGKSYPRIDKIELMANYFGVSKSDLVEDKSAQSVAEDSTEYKTKMVKIPIVGTVAAGVPISAIEDIQGYEEIPEQLAHTGEFYALRIKGDSMSPDIRNGDVVIVRVQPVADNNDIVIASVNGDEATCKRLKRYETELCLVPINPDYETMRFTPQEVNTLPVSVLGKVIELRRKYE